MNDYIIGSMLLCRNPDIWKDEQPIKHEFVESFLDMSKDSKFVAKTSQTDMISEMNKILEGNCMIVKISDISNDDIDLVSETSLIVEESNSLLLSDDISETSLIVDEKDTNFSNEDEIDTHKIISTIDFAYAKIHEELTLSSENGSEAFNKQRIETISRDEIGNNRDDIEEGVCSREGADSILLNNGVEDQIKCDEVKERCAGSFKGEVNVEIEEIDGETDEYHEILENKKEEILEDKLEKKINPDLQSPPLNTTVEEGINNEAEVDFEKLGEEECFIETRCKEVDLYEEPSLLYHSIDTQSWEMAYEILQRSPEEATTWIYCIEKNTVEYEWKFLPIHVACFSDAPLDFVQKLVVAYPQGIRMVATGGKLPLHIACETLAHSKVIKFLYKVYSEALYITDNLGNTPQQESMFGESKSNRKRVTRLLTSLQATKGYKSADTNDDKDCIPTAKSPPYANVFKFSLKKLTSSRKVIKSPL